MRASPAKTRKTEARPPAALPNTSPSATPSLLPIPLLLIAAALVVVALGGGTLYDRVPINPELVGPFSLLATPLTLILVGGAFALAYGRSPANAAALSRLPLFASAALLLWSAMSLVRSSFLHLSVSFLGVLAATVLTGAVISRSAHSRREYVALAFVLAVAALIVSGIGVNEYIRSWRGGDAAWRVYATFNAPNFLAGFLVTTLPLSIALFLAVEDRSQSLVAGLALVFQLLCLLLTQSRFGLLAFVLAIAVFLVLSGFGRLLTGGAQKRAFLLGGLALAAVLVGAKPVLSRLQAAGDQSYSARFRVLTWRGTAKMAQANPLLGTGLATFGSAYPRYAVVGYTRHAHNTFMQFAGETGVPGLLFLLLTLGGTLWTGLRRVRRRHADTAHEDTATENSTLPGLLLAGALASLVGACLVNLFDSDLYIPANALTLGAVCGLALALARSSSADSDADSDPNADRKPSGTVQRIAVGVAALFLVGHGVLLALGRNQALAAASTRDSKEAIEGYQAAEGWDGWNPDYPLKLANVYAAMGMSAEKAGRSDVAADSNAKAKAQYRTAIRVAPIGNHYARYGIFLTAIGEPEAAIPEHEAARQREPNDLRNLLALAEAYQKTGRSDAALGVYRDLVLQFDTDIGRVRAVPEKVEWEYGIAYLALAEEALQRGDNAGGEPLLKKAVDILGEFWRTHNDPMAVVAGSGEGQRTAVPAYARALDLWVAFLHEQGRTTEEAEAASRRAKFQVERQKEQGAE